MFARHMALSCPGTVLGSPDVLLFYHPPLAPCSLRFRESVSLTFNLLCCFLLFRGKTTSASKLCLASFSFFFFFYTKKEIAEINVSGPLVAAVYCSVLCFFLEDNNDKVSFHFIYVLNHSAL